MATERRSSKIVFGFQRIEVTWEQILLGLTLQALLERAATTYHLLSFIQTCHPCKEFCPGMMGVTQDGTPSVLNAILLFGECHVQELDF